MVSDPTRAVSRALREFANRGVFRSFSEGRARSGFPEFQFLWLTPYPFNLIFNPGKNSLTFRDLLPDMPARSELYAEVRSFLETLSSKERPAHRRLDRRRIGIRCFNRRTKVSIEFAILRREYRYGVRKSLEQVQELYLSFLNVYHPEYMVTNFHTDEE